MTDLSLKIDRLAAIKKQQDALKKEKDKLEAEIMMACESDLDSTKYKSVSYSGDAAEIKVINSESLKVLYNASAFLPDIFGKAYGAVVTEKKEYTISTAAARMIIGIRKGDYIRGASVGSAISQIEGITETQRKQLLKKCKGKNYDKDVENILKFTDLSKQDALEYAYLIYESAIWEEFSKLMQLNGADEEAVNRIIDKINAAFIVDEGTKLQLTVNEDD